MPSTAVLSVQGLRHRYGAREVLRAPDFVLAHDEHCALVGVSGCGKTTMLHALAGFLRPSAGTLLLDGDDLYRPARDDRWRAMRVGLVPQRLHLVGSLSAGDNVRLAQYCAGRPDDGAAGAWLQQLGLGERLAAAPAQLSMGQQQRVAIARALVNRPRLLLADEPTSALDDANALQAIDLLLDAARAAGALLLVATHDLRIRGRLARVIELVTPPGMP